MVEATADDADPLDEYSGTPTRRKLVEIAWYFLFIGIVGSGGVIAIAVLGALVPTVGAFGPSFIFIMGFFPYFARVRENTIVQTALTGVNAAVVGAILGATFVLAAESFVVDEPSIPLAIGDTVVDLFTVVLAIATYWLFVRGVHAAYLIAGGGAIGIGAFFLV